MPVQKHGIEYQVGADTGEAISNLQQFEREFEQMLEQMGKSPREIATFRIIAKEVERGVRSTDQLDAETRRLLDTYRTLKQQAKDRDFLGLQSHRDVRNQIEAVKRAYERLKRSGELTSKELAQAAQTMQRRIRDLERSTNGWLEALSSAKAELAAMAGSAAALGGIVAQAIAKLANVFDLPIGGVEALSDAINVLGNNTAATES